MTEAESCAKMEPCGCACVCRVEVVANGDGGRAEVGDDFGDEGGVAWFSSSRGG